LIFEIIVLEEVDVPPGRKSKNVCKTIEEGKIEEEEVLHLML
jgi:hypothetical protein